MKNIALFFLLSLLAGTLLSGCLKRIPHEIHSPCVANDIPDLTYATDAEPRHPCIRRPVNLGWRGE